MTYILTHRLNQDCLESFFSRVRGAAGYKDNPTALEAKHRMRLLLVGTSRGDVINSNCAGGATEDVNADTVTSSVFGDLSQGIDTPQSTQESEISTSLSCLEEDALNYIAGYVSYKFKHKIPGITKSESPVNSWTTQISLGHLAHASDDWLELCHKLEVSFRKVCGEGVPKNFTMKQLERSIPLKIGAYHEAATFYMRCRLHARIKHLSKDIIQQRLAKRQHKKNLHFTS